MVRRKYGGIIMTEEVKYDPWYKYGVIALYVEMFLAIAFSIFALYMTLSGEGGISKH